MLKQYIFNILLGIDDLTNTILLGDPDDSISGRLGRAMASGKPRFFVPPIFHLVNWVALKIFKQENHCQDAIATYPLTHELWNWSKK